MSKTESEKAPGKISPISEVASGKSLGFGEKRSDAFPRSLNEKRVKRRKNRYMPWLFLLILILALSGGLFWQPWKIKQEAPDSSRRLVTAVQQNVAATVLATGKILPQVGAEVNVGSRISGQLEKLFVNVGDPVKKWQVIAIIEKRDLEAQVAESEADVHLCEARLEALRQKGPDRIARAQAELDERRAALEFAVSEWKRMKSLRQKGVVTQLTLDQSKKEYDMAKAKAEAAERNYKSTKTDFRTGIEQHQAELAKAEAVLTKEKVKLDYAVIRAPLSGVVASVSTREGETVAAGFNAPTFVTIVDLERLQLDAYVDEVDIGRVKIGQRAVFTVDTYPDKEFEGRVAAIYPRPLIQENVVTYDCIITIDTPYSGLLKPEMTANVTIFYENLENILVLPVEAVKRRANQSIVFLKTEEGIEEVPVQTGWRGDSLIEITSGISPGNRVLLKSSSSDR